MDGGLKTICFVVDGKLHDGGDRRQFGWVRFLRELRTVDADDKVSLPPRIRGELLQVRIYDRARRTSEILGNWQATREKQSGLCLPRCAEIAPNTRF